MEFVKVHGTGNDFVLLPDFEGRLELDAALVRALCDRRQGLGGDGVLRLAPPERGADVFMDYRNADGSVAEMCGNGVRCVAKYVADRGLVTGDVVRVDTRAGLRTVEVVERDAGGLVSRLRVDMGAPRLTGTVAVDLGASTGAGAGPGRGRSEGAPAGAASGGEPDAAGGPPAQGRVELVTLSMGNPHAILQVPDPRGAPVARWGPLIERDPAFPGGTNVGFVAVRARDRVEGRIWERGVGETQASGTVASAMAVAANLWGLADRRTVVALPGGELEVEWDEETLYVTGPAVEVAGGQLDPAWTAQTPAQAGVGAQA